MRILVVHNRHRATTGSGEDRAVDQECAALSASGHDVERVERSNDEIAGLSLGAKARIPSQAVWRQRSMAELERALDAFRPAIVHVHNLLPLFSASVLATLGRRRVPCVATLHNYQLSCLNGSLFRAGSYCTRCVGQPLGVSGILHRCYRGSAMASVPLAIATMTARRYLLTVPSAYLFLSAAHRRELEGLGLPGDRCFVKCNLVPPPPGDRPLTRAHARSIVFLGRLEEMKGLPVLMEAWERYGEAGHPGGLRLVVAGAGPLDTSLRAWARGRTNVEVAGLVSRERASELVAAASAVVVPSQWKEPFGLVVAEAMAAGAPPIAPAHAAFQELITDQRDGLLYPPGDAAGLASQVCRVGDDPAWAARLGAAARTTYERRFSPAAVVPRLEAVYRFALERPRWASEDAGRGGEERAAEAAPR